MITLSKTINKAIWLDNKIYGYRNNHGSLTSKRWRSLGRVKDCIKLSQKILDMIHYESDIVFKAKLINRFRTSKNAVYGEMKACKESNKEILKQVSKLRLDLGVVLSAKLTVKDKTRELILYFLPFLDSYTTFKIVDKIRCLSYSEKGL